MFHLKNIIITVRRAESELPSEISKQVKVILAPSFSV